MPAGLLLLGVVLVDLLWTTLWVDGGSGPISARIASGLWALARRTVGRSSTGVSVAGPAILVTTLVTWIVLVWLGWSLVFASGEPSLVAASEKVPVGPAGTMYYVAYAMFAAGNGDFFPATPTWQLATAALIGTGILLVTLAITYVLSVIGAVPDKRSFASGVEGLGRNGPAVVIHTWNGDGFEGFTQRFDTLTAELDRLAQDHLAYPILHYYHTRRGEHAAARALAVFDEALTLLRFGVPEDHRPDGAVLAAARSASRNYLLTLEETFDFPHDEPPPPPSLERLREAGIPTVSDEAFAAALDDLGDRRRKLLGVVEADAQPWPGETR